MSVNGIANRRIFAMSSVLAMTPAVRRPLFHSPDPRLRAAVLRALWLGTTLVLLFPAARGHNAWLGWMPLWLLGMPLSALWALHRFRMPHWPASATARRQLRRRRGGQARRRPLRPGARRSVRAA